MNMVKEESQDMEHKPDDEAPGAEADMKESELSEGSEESVEDEQSGDESEKDRAEGMSSVHFCLNHAYIELPSVCEVYTLKPSDRPMQAKLCLRKQLSRKKSTKQ